MAKSYILSLCCLSILGLSLVSCSDDAPEAETANATVNLLEQKGIAPADYDYKLWRTIADMSHKKKAEVSDDEIALIKALITAGADLERPIYWSMAGHQTCIECLASLGLTDCLQAAFDRGYDINKKNTPLTLKDGETFDYNVGYTLLHFAAASDPDCVKFLLSKGAKILPANDGFTPMHAAARSGKAKCLELLLQAGAEVDCVYNSHRFDSYATPLYMAAEFGRHDCVKVLLKAGANVDFRDRCGKTPLDKAVAGGYEGCAQILRMYASGLL